VQSAPRLAQGVEKRTTLVRVATSSAPSFATSMPTGAPGTLPKA
jgi:hypothetical protein